MKLFYWDRELQRVWLVQRRIHHGMVGALLCCAGAALMTHDRRDYKEWFKYAHFLTENTSIMVEPIMEVIESQTAGYE